MAETGDGAQRDPHVGRDELLARPPLEAAADAAGLLVRAAPAPPEPAILLGADHLGPDRLEGDRQETVWNYSATRAAAVNAERKGLAETFGFDPTRWGREL